VSGKAEAPPLTAAQRQLVLDAQGSLRRASRRLIVKYRGLVGRDDVLQTMQLALAEAARTYDPDRSTSFLSFARQAVTGAVVRVAGKEADARAPLRKIFGASASLERGEVGFEEDDAAIGTRAHAMGARLAAAWALGLATQPEAAGEAAELERVVRGAIDALPERSRAVVERVYFEEQSLLQVAEALGVSYATVRRDNEEALAAIRKACEKGGY
jgi:RNA polymerase sigma factor for flagellar operon FliA